jgi:hypothetical protein
MLFSTRTQNALIVSAATNGPLTIYANAQNNFSVNVSAPRVV